ncbi:MAG: glutaredoxin family protein [Euryarchaeota archaeon]|nr:glutaredoxin family protein [Euryarchaeota archaeon]
MPARADGPVKVYTTPTCPWCKEAKAFLEAKGVAYNEIDVSRNRKLVDELKAVSGQLGVPVVTDGRTVVIGFDRAGLERLTKALAL